jgi:RNA polymerase sigma-70 factor (ECF subfamily)
VAEPEFDSGGSGEIRRTGNPAASELAPNRLNPDEVRRLYEAHSEELRRFLLGVCRDPQAAADAMQAALVKAIEQGHTARDESRKAWLFRVAFHEALATRRREATTERVLQTAVWHVGTEERETGAESATRREQAAAVRAAVAGLPADLQAVVRLRIHENLTFAEISARLAIPLGTALTRMRSALARLKTVLERHKP